MTNGRLLSRRGIAAGVALVLAGAMCGEWLQNGSAAGGAGDEISGSPSAGGGSGAGGGAIAADRSPLAQQTRARLVALAQEPLATLGDDEISGLVATLDLTRDADINLLNGVLNLKLREQLWRAAVKKGAERLPMAALAALSSRIYLEKSDFIKVSMFERMGRGTAHLDWYAPESVPLRYEYTHQCAEGEGSLKEKLALLPEEATSYRQDLITVSSQKSATMADLREVIALPDRRSLAPALVSMAQRTWVKLAPEDRGELYAELRKLPADERNTVLAGLASGFNTAAPRDPDTMVGLMAEATSLATQKVIADWLRNAPDGSNDVGPWLEAIDRSPDSARLQKIRAVLASAAVK